MFVCIFNLGWNSKNYMTIVGYIQGDFNSMFVFEAGFFSVHMIFHFDCKLAYIFRSFGPKQRKICHFIHTRGWSKLMLCSTRIYPQMQSSESLLLPVTREILHTTANHVPWNFKCPPSDFCHSDIDYVNLWDGQGNKIPIVL